MNEGNKTFKRITNNDIYNLMITQGKDFQKIKIKVYVNAWMSATALTGMFVILGVIL